MSKYSVDEVTSKKGLARSFISFIHCIIPATDLSFCCPVDFTLSLIGLTTVRKGKH